MKNYQKLFLCFKNHLLNLHRLLKHGTLWFFNCMGVTKVNPFVIWDINVLPKSLNKGQFTPASLPPTDAGAWFHSLRTYHQVQKWLGNDLPTTQWGWNGTTNGLTQSLQIKTLLFQSCSALYLVKASKFARQPLVAVEGWIEMLCNMYFMQWVIVFKLRDNHRWRGLWWSHWYNIRRLPSAKWKKITDVIE